MQKSLDALNDFRVPLFARLLSVTQLNLGEAFMVFEKRGCMHTTNWGGENQGCKNGLHSPQNTTPQEKTLHIIVAV